MNRVHFLVPGALDDPAHPSGGNRYDRRLRSELVRAGWQVRLVRIGGARQVDERALLDELTALPQAEPVLMDGLLAAAAPAVVAAHARRLRIVILLHMLPAGPDESSGYPLVLRAARAVITTSEWARRQLRETGYAEPGRIVAAPPGVDQALPVVASPSGARLRCVAALLPHKGQDVLLDALRRIRALDWTCDLLGAADLDVAFTRGLHDQARTSGISPRVRFLEPRPATRTRELYDGADLLVVPSLTESYGMVVTEAIACGIPVVAADTGGISEAMGTGDSRRPGLLVPPGDAAGLAEALEAWLTRPALRAQLTAAAHERRRGLPAWQTTAATAARVLASARDEP